MSKEEKKEAKPKVVLGDDFDLKAYAESYSSHAKVIRLIFVADNVEGMEKAALDMAVAELLKSGDPRMYRTIADRAGVPVDTNWISKVEKDAITLKERLDAELSAAKTSLMKDDIRSSHNALGELYYNRNDLNSAFKCFVRTRDYCSSSQHILEMCLNVIKTALEQGNYSHVINYVSKAEQTADIDPVIAAKLKIATGLSHLHNRKYKSAARAFLDAAVDMRGNTFSEVVSSTDVAIYAGLCSLAQFDRSELKRLVINNPRFKSFLDLAPDVGDLIMAFYNCKYTEALDLLAKIRPRVVIDPYLCDHVTLLARQIRNKGIIQFFTPFSAVDMKMMAAAFNTSVADLEVELKNLIVEGEIQARIDSFNQVLVAKQVNQRTRMFQKATNVGKEHNANMRDMLLRMDLSIKEFNVKPNRRQGDGGGKKKGY